MKHLISIRDMTKKEILNFLNAAEKIEKSEMRPKFPDSIMSILFFEPSTRTRFSFETAMKKLSGKTITMSGSAGTSMEKGESFADTIKTISRYSNIMVIRSAIEGSVRYAAEIAGIPVINAGDGANQHPSQALLDLYSIKKTQAGIENKTIAIVGDLKYGRAVHSLVDAMSHFAPEFYFISPRHLRLPKKFRDELDRKKIKYNECAEIEEVIPALDIMYVTRIQRERFVDIEEYEKVKNSYVLKPEMLKNVKNNFKILHPLPRVNEIDCGVDVTPYAYYFDQAENGVYIRQAIISILLEGAQ
ncbi:MAG: hypothetical protein ACD_47C00332G0003 [uncultured bacterium]|nr:MAG: hypothetical protein ACD_47C00332G0003 [uncultured bacterium]